jgi:2-dehydro-3-deoxygluconokinase
MTGEDSKTVVTFGEIMLRLSTPGNLRFIQVSSFDATYGGGEANVAVALSGFGAPARFVTRLPAGDLGDAALSSLRKHGVDVSRVIRGGDRLGIYFLETGAAQRASKVIYDRAGSSFATIGPGMVRWDSALAGAGWFHWTGITPAVSEGAAAALAEGIAAARKAGITISCDLNYRSKLWKWGKTAGEVMADLVAGSDVVIANEEDAEKVFGLRAPHSTVTEGRIAPEGYRGVGEELCRRFPKLRRVAFTLRSSHSASHNTWSAALFSPAEDEFLLARSYSIQPIVDRVGGGDAFAAGLIFGLRRHGEDGPSRRRALEFAVAASCLKHTVPGDFNLVTVAEVEALLAGDESGRVSR